MNLFERVAPISFIFFGMFTGVSASGYFGKGQVFLCTSAIVGLYFLFLIRKHASLPRPQILFVLGLFLGALWFHNTNDRVTLPRGIYNNTDVQIEFEVLEVQARNRKQTKALIKLRKMGKIEGNLERIKDYKASLRAYGLIEIVEGSVLKTVARLQLPTPLDYTSPSDPGITFIVKDASSLELLQPPKVFSFDRARMSIAKRLSQLVHDDTLDLVLALCLGEGKGVSPSIRFALSKLGTAHILAVSGLHVSIAGVFSAFFIVTLLGRPLVRILPSANLLALKKVLACLMALVVTFLASFTPSATRASAMFILSGLSIFLGRPQALLTTMSFAGVIDILFRPTTVFSMSFVLSYSALTGIALGMNLANNFHFLKKLSSCKSILSRLLGHVVNAGIISLSASIATAPISYIAFGTWSYVSPLANLVVLPVFTMLIMPLCLLLLFTSYLNLGDITAPLVTSVLSAFIHAQMAISSCLPTISPKFLIIPAIFLCVSLLFKQLRYFRAMVFVWLLFPFVAWCSFKTQDPALQILFLKVGKGDSILIRCPTKKHFLVDTGSERAHRSLLSFLIKAHATSLTKVILTHGDEDHIGGLKHLIGVIHIEEVSVPCQETKRPIVRSLLEDASRHKVRVSCFFAGIDPLEQCGTQNETLWPPAGAPVQGNDASAVIKISWERHSVLLTGDITVDAQAQILGSNRSSLASDVVQLPHHGSPKSLSQDLLAIAKPAIVVASGFADRRRKKFPSETQEKVHDARALLFRTQDEGTVIVTISKNSAKISSSLRPSMDIAILNTPHYGAR